MRKIDWLRKMRDAPEDRSLQLVYSDWLLEQGDERGELIALDLQEEQSELPNNAALRRLLVLAAQYGFPRLPDDLDTELGILPFRGGGQYPVQYELRHEGREYYIRWRSGFSIDIDDEEVLECDLDLEPGEWTGEETNVMLTIISDAIASGQPLSKLTFPDAKGFCDHSSYHLGPFPHDSLPKEFLASLGPESQSWTLTCRDREHWHILWDRLSV